MRPQATINCPREFKQGLVIQLDDPKHAGHVDKAAAFGAVQNELAENVTHMPAPKPEHLQATGPKACLGRHDQERLVRWSWLGQRQGKPARRHEREERASSLCCAVREHFW